MTLSADFKTAITESETGHRMSLSFQGGMFTFILYLRRSKHPQIARSFESEFNIYIYFFVFVAGETEQIFHLENHRTF